MKHQLTYLPFIMATVFALACSALPQQATPVAQVLPTRTPLPTFTATPAPASDTADTTGALPAPTATAVPPTATSPPVATPTPPPTDTPAPEDSPAPEPTDTPPPEPTDTPVPAANTPLPPAPPATNTPLPAPAGPVIGQFGISGKVVTRDKTTFAVGEKAFFTYEATNHGDNPVQFTLLGIKASNGQFNTSWINPDVIVPGVPFRHDDGLAFNVPGTYQVFLAICYTGCDGGEAVWEEYQDGAATITVQ